jgi:hypothetical protein
VILRELSRGPPGIEPTFLQPGDQRSSKGPNLFRCGTPGSESDAVSGSESPIHRIDRSELRVFLKSAKDLRSGETGYGGGEQGLEEFPQHGESVFHHGRGLAPGLGLRLEYREEPTGDLVRMAGVGARRRGSRGPGAVHAVPAKGHPARAGKNRRKEEQKGYEGPEGVRWPRGEERSRCRSFVRRGEDGFDHDPTQRNL